MQRKGGTMRYSAEELKSMRERGEGRSDWDRVKNLTNGEIERAIAEDSDAGTLPESWPEGVGIGMPRAKERITVRLDADVLGLVQEPRQRLSDAQQRCPEGLR
jgi:hypothetical protein